MISRNCDSICPDCGEERTGWFCFPCLREKALPCPKCGEKLILGMGCYTCFEPSKREDKDETVLP